MLLSGCVDRECRVRIGYAIVRVCDVRKRRVPAWGIQMELIQIALFFPPGRKFSHLEFCSANIFHPDIPHPEFCPGDVPPSPDVSHPTDISGWERRAFQLPWSDISGSADSANPESFADILHSAVVFS
uniref:Uncharacterized protein n=1 Tax=Vitis vinifera TaxID=29760 RepID=A5B293_VITVI|nr:hypothetical protein VITISV_007657 [Vitis vinifera]